jgi:predicted  nucleic acid-binding Zn-ribbon protein
LFKFSPNSYQPEILGAILALKDDIKNLDQRMDRRMGKMDEKMEKMDERMERMDERMEKMEERMERMETKSDTMEQTIDFESIKIRHSLPGL